MSSVSWMFGSGKLSDLVTSLTFLNSKQRQYLFSSWGLSGYGDFLGT